MWSMIRFIHKMWSLLLKSSNKSNKPGRSTVALTVMQMCYLQAFENYRNQENKAISLVAWVAAVLAISMFQELSPSTHWSGIVKISSLVAFIFSAIFGVIALPAPFSNNAGINDPIDLMNYQQSDHWDTLDTNPDIVNRIAEAETEAALIKKIDDSIKNLRKLTEIKYKQIKAAYFFFLVGVILLAVCSMCIYCRI